MNEVLQSLKERRSIRKYKVLLLAVFVLALPKTFAKTCSHVLPHNGLKFGTSQDAKL